MLTNEVEIKDTRYILLSNYQDNQSLRSSLNELVQSTFGFNFETWYACGYWGANYIPYSLIHQDKVVANVSINKMELLFEKGRKEAVQIGTVMTHKDYQGQGLIRFIMEWVLREWKDRSDFIYLFANPDVLDFYPKFNFEIVHEYQHSKLLRPKKNKTAIRKLNMNNSSDRKLFNKTVAESIPIARLTVLNNISLAMFYGLSHKKNSIFYLKYYDAVAIADIVGDVLLLSDVFSKAPVNLDHVIESIAEEATKKVVLGFTPLSDKGYDTSPLVQNDTLFVSKEGTGRLKEGKWMFPLLSHG